jgi:tRNA(fMet)-specific endonuclease VapC
MAAPLYLLDTNIIVAYIRDSEVWRQIVAAHQPLTVTPTPLYCVVTEGELLSLALQWSWGSHKQEQLKFSLSFFQPKTIVDPDVMRMYATLDSHCKSLGHKMGKNDLWIAATAAAAGATLLTSDRDFDHLPPNLPARIWIDPDTH